MRRSWWRNDRTFERPGLPALAAKGQPLQSQVAWLYDVFMCDASKHHTGHGRFASCASAYNLDRVASRMHRALCYKAVY